MIFSILKNTDNLVSKQDLKMFLNAVMGIRNKDMLDFTTPNDPYGGFAYNGKYMFKNEA